MNREFEIRLRDLMDKLDLTEDGRAELRAFAEDLANHEWDAGRNNLLEAGYVQPDPDKY